MARINRTLNVIWIVVDGARNYHTGIDDRDRLDIMDSMKSETVNFEAAVTSAPSSALACAAMMTGLDCAYIARHFSDFRFEKKRVACVPSFMRERGYQVTSIHDAPQGREMLRDLICPLPYPDFPKGFSHAQHWTNEEIYTILKHQFDAVRMREPAFILLWFDCRCDPNVSNTVERAVNLLKEQGIYENSFFVMCSDHGYPDPSTGLTVQTMKKYAHDMIVTDDNILVPLLIRYPGSPVKSVKDVVGLCDIFPTVLDVLGVEGREQLTAEMQGQSLVPLIEGKSWDPDRFVRIDTRLELASGRITALRGTRYKYIFYHDSHNEELYDLQSDPHELNNIIDGPEVSEVAENYRKAFKESQYSIDSFHLEEMGDNYAKNVGKLYPSRRAKRVKNIIILTESPVLFLSHLQKLLRPTFPNARIDYLVDRSRPPQEGIEDVGFDAIVHCDKLNPANIRQGMKTGTCHRYDLVIVTTENHRTALSSLDMKVIRLFRKRRIALIDYNMQVYSRFLRKWIWPFRRFAEQWVFYRHEPWLMLRDVLKTVRWGIASRVLGRKPLTLDAEWAKQRRDRDLRIAGRQACPHKAEE